MIDLRDQLASRVGDPTGAANLQVAERCLIDPSLLGQIVAIMQGPDPALAKDAADVIAKVAAERPEALAPYAETLASHIEQQHGGERSRAAGMPQAMEVLALIAPVAPRSIRPLLPLLAQIASADKSADVRDTAIDAISSYGRSSPAAAALASPVLRDVVKRVDGEQAARAMAAVARLSPLTPEQTDNVTETTRRYARATRAGARATAKGLLRTFTER